MTVLGYVMSILFGVFFLFKQKTAYERRISDCGSDVCSSDLQLCARRRRRPQLSGLVVLGWPVVQAVRSSWQPLSPEQAASQPSNISFKRTANRKSVV